jgi:hypothetical protein
VKATCTYRSTKCPRALLWHNCTAVSHIFSPQHIRQNIPSHQLCPAPQVSSLSRHVVATHPHISFPPHLHQRHTHVAPSPQLFESSVNLCYPRSPCSGPDAVNPIDPAQYAKVQRVQESTYCLRYEFYGRSSNSRCSPWWDRKLTIRRDEGYKAINEHEQSDD